MTTVVTANAPGKLFLTGEYAVLGGAPAVVAAIDRRVDVRCRLTPGPDAVVIESLAEGGRYTASAAERGPLPGGDAGAVLAALRVARARGLAAGRVEAVVDSRAFLLAGRKLGLGRSAATVTAAIAALVAGDDAFAAAVEAHADFQEGRGSGADVAAAFHGGLVEVQRRDERLAVRARTLPAGLHLVVGYTGEAALTDPMLRRFAAAPVPRVLRDLHGASERAAQAVARSDAAALLEAVDAAGDLLAALGEEAGIPIVTPALARLVALARGAGAAAKPSGAGGGDCGIALARSAEEAAAVRAAWASEGLVPLALSIAAEGVRHTRASEEMDETPLAGSISDRKRSHLELCQGAAVEFKGKTTLLEEVDLVHDALPELAVDEVAIGTELLGKRLRAPLLITGMTGGTAEASSINRALAQVAEEHGIAFGLGSQRAMQRTPALAYTFEVREYAPTALVLANLGLVQAAALKTAEVEQLVRAVGADALCLHLNPAQELIQPGGDRDFRGGIGTITRLVRELPLPVVVKETGCGLSRQVGERLLAAGVRTADVSGAGGTSWVKVETLRAGEAERELGEQFADWGIPTAAALLGLRGLGFALIASGGIRTGLDVAKAVALGARVAGVALPVFRAYREGGTVAAGQFIERLTAGLRTAMVLTGCRDLAALGRARVVLGSRLREWVSAGGGA